MPFYDYECPVCNKKVSQRRTYADMEKEEDCPVEGCTGKLIKLLTVGRVISYNVPL